MTVLTTTRLLAAASALALMPSPVSAQRAGIVGRVLDDGTGSTISGATVRIAGGASAQSNDNGYFSLLGISPGALDLQVSAPGYAPTGKTISVAPGEVLEVELRLATRPIELGEIVVHVPASGISPWLVANGFAARRADGLGLLHFTQRDLRFQGGSSLADVLRRIPGVRIRRLGNGGSQLLLDPTPRADGSPCPVAIYLNGSAVELGEFHWTGVRHTQRAMRPMRFDDLLRLEEVDGMELYGPDASPVGSEADCGALLLWSSDLRASLDEPLLGGIRGLVHDAEGLPLAGAEIALHPLDLKTVTDRSGRFQLPDLAPGRYRLVVRTDDLTFRELEVFVKAYATNEIDIRVSRSPGAVPTDVS